MFNLSSLIPDAVANGTLFVIVGSLSVALVSMGKAGFGGGGFGLAAVPVMVLACGGNTQLALGIMLPVLIVNDYVALAAWVRHVKLRAVLLMLPGMVLGTVLGGLVLWGFQQLGRGDAAAALAAKSQTNAAVMLTVGLISLSFLALRLIRARRGQLIVLRPVPWQGIAVGSAAGLTSTMAHAAGPMVQMYMLAQQMPKRQFVATTLLYFWVGNQIKLVPYAMLDILNDASLGASALFLPAMIGGVALGVALHNRVDEKRFAIVIQVLIVISSAAMVVKGVQGLLG